MDILLKTEMSTITPKLSFVAHLISLIYCSRLHVNIYLIIVFHSILEMMERLRPVIGARCSSMVKHPLTIQRVVASIPHGGLIELFCVPASAPRMV